MGRNLGSVIKLQLAPIRMRLGEVYVGADEFYIHDLMHGPGPVLVDLAEGPRPERTRVLRPFRGDVVTEAVNQLKVGCGDSRKRVGIEPVLSRVPRFHEFPNCFFFCVRSLCAQRDSAHGKQE